MSAACADYRHARFAPVDVRDVERELGGARGPDHLLAAVADRQHGLVLDSQLGSVGLGRRGMADRVRRGRLLRLHHRVYLVERCEPTWLGTLAAGVLAAGTCAVLTHRSALELWGALPVTVADQVHVTVPSQRRHRAGLTIHRTRGLALDDCAAIANIPLTAPARSLLDFAVGADPGALEAALNEARVEKLIRAGGLERLRGRTPGHHGWGPLNRLLDAEREPDFSRREAERRLLRLIREAHLPEPRRNVRLHGYEVDLYWPEQGLVVEVDSWAYHGNRTAFERDRRKQDDLLDHDLEVLRFTWRQITGRRSWLIARVATRLARGGRSRGPG